MTTEQNSTQPGAYIKANGIDIYYEESGSGYPLLLIHGGSVTCKMWQPYIGPLAQHFRVITPDKSRAWPNEQFGKRTELPGDGNRCGRLY